MYFHRTRRYKVTRIATEEWLEVAGEGWDGVWRGRRRGRRLVTVALRHGLTDTTLDVEYHLWSAGRAEHIPRVHMVVVYRRGDGILQSNETTKIT